MKMKQVLKIIIFCILLLSIIFEFIVRTTTYQTNYGVWIGLHPDNISALKPYDTVVIDASLFSKEQIESLHQQGKTVYSYLNIGSLENFRPYFSDFQDMTLGAYENWEEEYWIDVSEKKWQFHITQILAKQLVEKEVDGFFLDNVDVWYFYPKKEIYDGLINILQQLKEKYHLPIIVNGGDTFVSTLINSENIHLIDGVNQESVFTGIDFEHNTFGKQEKQQTAYFLNYLVECKKAGLSVYLLEYGNPHGKNYRCYQKMKKVCKKLKFEYYISPSIELK